MFGTPRHHYFEVDSTNTQARAMARDGAAHGTAVTAEFQRDGRGRDERRWTSDPGENLLVSFIVRPSRPAEEWGGIALLSGLAVHGMLHDTFSIDGDLHWPNDVYVGGRKIAGVLIESGQDATGPHVVIGIGVNVNQRFFVGDYRVEPTSLAIECGRPAVIDAVFTALAAQLDAQFRRWEQRGTASMAAAWTTHSGMFDGDALVRIDGVHQRVRPRALADDGGLIVDLDDGSRRTLYAGDVDRAR